jgi:hypothetical protein
MQRAPAGFAPHGYRRTNVDLVRLRPPFPVRQRLASLINFCDKAATNVIPANTATLPNNHNSQASVRLAAQFQLCTRFLHETATNEQTNKKQITTTNKYQTNNKQQKQANATLGKK